MQSRNSAFSQIKRSPVDSVSPTENQLSALFKLFQTAHNLQKTEFSCKAFEKSSTNGFFQAHDSSNNLSQPLFNQYPINPYQQTLNKEEKQFPVNSIVRSGVSEEHKMVYNKVLKKANTENSTFIVKSKAKGCSTGTNTPKSSDDESPRHEIIPSNLNDIIDELLVRPGDSKSKKPSRITTSPLKRKRTLIRRSTTEFDDILEQKKDSPQKKTQAEDQNSTLCKKRASPSLLESLLEEIVDDKTDKAAPDFQSVDNKFNLEFLDRNPDDWLLVLSKDIKRRKPDSNSKSCLFQSSTQ